MKLAKLLTGLIRPGEPPGKSFLAERETRFVQQILATLPPQASAPLLTKLSLAGALIAAAGLLGCRFALWPVFLVPLGVALNWFGAAVDGPLGFQRGERGSKRRWLEHLTDLVSLLIVIAAYGFSPFLSIESSLVIMACFLLFSAYSFLRAAVGRAVQTTLIGVGATEFRLLTAIWPFIAMALGLNHPGAGGSGRLDLAIIMLSLVAILTLIVNIIVDGRSISSSQP
jgi:hypothetical protein